MKDKNNINTFLRILSGVVTSETIKFDTTKKEKRFRFFSILYAGIVSLLIMSSLSTLLVTNNIQLKYSIIFSVIEISLLFVLIIDYILRFYNVYITNKRHHKNPYIILLWQFSFTSILLILSMLPSLYIISIWTNYNTSVFNFFENLKFLRIFRLLLFLKLFPITSIFVKVFKNEGKILTIVFFFVLLTIFTFALVIYNLENENVKEIADSNLGPNHRIKDFWDAFYYSTIALTTIGFGDITPITSLGRWLTIIMSIIGVAIIAIPTGIISGGFIAEAKKIHYLKKNNNLEK